MRIKEDRNGIKPLSRSHTLNRENTSGAIAAVMRDNDDDDAFQNLEDYPRRFGVKVICKQKQGHVKVIVIF